MAVCTMYVFLTTLVILRFKTDVLSQMQLVAAKGKMARQEAEGAETKQPVADAKATTITG